MSFRARFLLGALVAAALPILGLGYAVRREMVGRLDAANARRMGELSVVIRNDLERRVADTRGRLRGLAAELEQSNQLRLALRGFGERDWLRDWAATAARWSGLPVLALQDSAGRILSSGHFRNDYDRLAPELPAGLAATSDSAALAVVTTPDGPRLALAALVPLEVGRERLTIVGGELVDSARLGGWARGDLAVSLVRGDSACAGTELGAVESEAVPLSSCRPAGAVGDLALPLIDPRTGSVGTARVVARPTGNEAAELLRRVDRWILVTLGGGLLVALAIGAWLSGLLTRPLTELARKTEQVDLDRVEEPFATGRSDEIGALAELLDQMTRRIRSSTGRLREAERRAATGDLARQVNHDVKNGLVPIRNVLRHLKQTADADPATLPTVWAERWPTLEASVGYLEGLARSYAKLAPALDREACDANQLLAELATGAGRPGVEIRLALDPELGPVRVDRVALRRILENLLSNAVDALDGAGRVTLASAAIQREGLPAARITVADTGRGMSREELARAFDDFYTTKPDGTGLGLSVVRRLVADLGGALRVETEPGAGSRFIVEIPTA